MPKRDAQKLVLSESEVKSLLDDLRVRFSWCFFLLNEEQDLDEAMEDFVTLCEQDPSTLSYSIASFGTGRS